MGHLADSLLDEVGLDLGLLTYLHYGAGTLCIRSAPTRAEVRRSFGLERVLPRDELLCALVCKQKTES